MSITGANNPFSCTPVVFSAGNQILQLGTITRDGNEFTFSVGFVWKINGVTYQNTAAVVLTIAEASEGFYRIDNAILNTSNSIELQQGLESETIALQPVVPDTNILLTSWNISGDTIGDEETPLVGTQFKKKDENQKITQVLGGTDAVIELRTLGQQHYSVIGPVTSIAGFSKDLIVASPTAEVPYAGKDFYFENKTDHNVTLKNAFSPVDIPFNLGADLVVPQNGIVWLKYNPSTEKMDLFFKSWSEVDLSTKADLVDGKVPPSQLPSYVDDVLEFADFASFPGTGENGKIYVALDTNFTYRWSGSAYIKISDSGKVDKVTTSGVERAYIINADGSQSTKPTSEFGISLPDLQKYSIYAWRPTPTGWYGFSTPAFVGTADNQSPLFSGNDFIKSVRHRRLSASTAGSSAEYYEQSFKQTSIGDGFFFSIKFGNEDASAVSDARVFAGLLGSLTVFGNVNPSTQANIFGVGADSGDANLSFIHNDSAGTATKVSLGASFPANTITTDLYCLQMYNVPGSASIWYRVINISTKVETAWVEITTNLPATNFNLLPRFWRNNGTTALAVRASLVDMTLYKRI
jgi:hypothetical protein